MPFDFTAGSLGGLYDTESVIGHANGLWIPNHSTLKRICMPFKRIIACLTPQL